MDVIYSGAQSAKRYAASLAWGPTVQFSRSAILSVLQRVKTGQLRIVDVDRKVTLCGSPDEKTLATELRIHNEAFWVRVLLFADMGFAEAYMLGEFSCTNLTVFFEVSLPRSIS